jgi:hypothetical protein
MLLDEVMPRLRNAARSIPKIGCEDDEEVIQDCALQAARMMVAAEQAGKQYTGGNMAYFATRAARSGRRSYYTGRSDVMSPGCIIDGKAKHEWMDLEIEMEFGDVGTLHDVICPFNSWDQEADPGEQASRNLDWTSFLENSPQRFRVAIDVLASGGTMREAGKELGIGDSGAHALKRKIGAALIEFFGEDVIRRLLDGVRPAWESDLRAVREGVHHSEVTFQTQPQPVC